jgi:hypothetical protein
LCASQACTQKQMCIQMCPLVCSGGDGISSLWILHSVIQHLQQNKTFFSPLPWCPLSQGPALLPYFCQNLSISLISFCLAMTTDHKTNKTIVRMLVLRTVGAAWPPSAHLECPVDTQESEAHTSSTRRPGSKCLCMFLSLAV